MAANLTFSGHDTFHCRPFWLKKGYDFLKNNGNFNDDNAVVALGVGKNMVTAIRYWLKSFGIIDENEQITSLAEKLFADNGWDPFLEDEGSTWLLHYLLHREQKASIFYLIFSELRKTKPEFSVQNFIDFVQQKGSYNSNTLKSDFTVFYRTYFGKKDEKDIEESFTGILVELNLLNEVEKTVLFDKTKSSKKNYWVIERKARPEIPVNVLLYAILENKNYGMSISFESLYDDPDGIGSIFALNKEGLIDKLEELHNVKDYNIVFSNEAGIRELQFKSEKPDSMSVLENYYYGKN